MSAALHGDETIPREFAAYVESVLAGEAAAVGSDHKPNSCAYMNAGEAANYLGFGRTWFWEQVKLDLLRPGKEKLLPRYELSSGEFRYKREDVEAYPSRATAFFARSRRKLKK